MGVCWYCYWGWSKPVMDIYKKALKNLGRDNHPLIYGPSHVVWADENFESAEWCLKHFDAYKNDCSVDELAIVYQSLIELTKLPLSVRCPKPDNYDEEHPELWPPKIEMVKE